MEKPVVELSVEPASPDTSRPSDGRNGFRARSRPELAPLHQNDAQQAETGRQTRARAMTVEVLPGVVSPVRTRTSFYSPAHKAIRTVSSQRRFRHLSGVLCRALPIPTSASTLASTFFRIYRGDKVAEDKLIYQSEVVPNTQNPSWAPIETTAEMLAAVARDTLFTAAVFAANSDPELLLEVAFDVRHLNYICCLPGLRDRVFPTATLLLAIGNGLYLPGAPDPTSDDEEDSELVVPAGRDTTSMTFLDLRSTGLHLARATIALNECRADVATLQARIAEATERTFQRRAAAVAVAAARQRVAALQERVRRGKASLLEAQANLSRRSQQHRLTASALVDAMHGLEDVRTTCAATAAIVDARSATSVPELAQCIESRRRHLLWGVAQIYPIETDTRPQAGDRQTIARMHLSSSEMATDEEAATALGYVAHVVQLLGKVWGIQLRYKLYPICSRSYVQEDFIDMPSLIHPLFYQRGSDKNKYFKSILLLNRNILQLLCVRGHLDGRHSNCPASQMLKNLKYLLTEGQGLESQSPTT